MDKLADALQKIAEKIGVTAQYLWPKVVWLEFVQSLIAFLISAAFLTVGLIGFPRALKALIALYKQEQGPDEVDEVVPIIRVIVFGLCLLGGLLSVAVGWTGWISGMLAPEGSLVLRALGK